MKITASLTFHLLALACGVAIVGCKQPSGSTTMGATDSNRQNPVVQNNKGATPTPSTTSNQVRQLTAMEWFSKKNVSVEEARTVDALLQSVVVLENKSGSPESLARWAAGGMKVAVLDGQNLTNISPILAFKNISTLHITGNRFDQSQIDELLKGLPKLKVLALDKGLTCDANPKVTCMY
ncbi:MAG: hypothetical protein ACO3A4_00970 [Silvanigrellaceae bacterium]